MSETTTTDTSVSRPWHGSDSPFEALHDWMITELAAIRTEANPTIKALEARIMELESRPAPTPAAVPAIETPPAERARPYVPPAVLGNPIPQTVVPVTSEPAAIIENGTIAAVQVPADAPSESVTSGGTPALSVDPTV